MGVVAAVAVAFGPLDNIGQASHVGIDALAWLVTLSGTAALIGTVFRRWLTELVAVYVLTTGMLVYTIADWLVLIFDVGYPPASAAALAVGGGLAVVAAVSTGQRRWRWVALAAAAGVLVVTFPMYGRNPAVITLATALLASRAIVLTVFRMSTVQAQRQAHAIEDQGA